MVTLNVYCLVIIYYMNMRMKVDISKLILLVLNIKLF